jgi:VCBS repeat-containing protein
LGCVAAPLPAGSTPVENFTVTTSDGTATTTATYAVNITPANDAPFILNHRLVANK